MNGNARLLTGCCITTMAALLVVGAVSSEIIRHIVQTSPLWIATVLSIRRSEWSKWATLPCFVFWLLLMTAIWLSLLGWAHILSGIFSPTEIAMTVIVGVASLVGIATALRIKSSLNPWLAAATVLSVAGLQGAALQISLLPAISHR